MKLYAGDAGQDGNSQLQKDSQALPLSPATRQLYAYVPQGNAMFSGTIADNMRSVKPDATDKEIIDCLKKACAWEFIGQLPDTIYEKIGERGNNFSEGQAQRLSIARALLKNAPVLLLDEATSALDIETEKQVLKNIMEDSLPRTCIVTTHRPTALKLCKNVYAIQDTRCRQLLPEENTKNHQGLLKIPDDFLYAACYGFLCISTYRHRPSQSHHKAGVRYAPSSDSGCRYQHRSFPSIFQAGVRSRCNGKPDIRYSRNADIRSCIIIVRCMPYTIHVFAVAFWCGNPAVCIVTAGSIYPFIMLLCVDNDRFFIVCHN